MSTLQCEREIPQVAKLKDQELTVGRHILLHCQGEIPSDFSINAATIKLPENQKKSVKVLKLEFKNQTGLELDFTFYSAGEFKFPDFILTDEHSEIHLGTQNFKIETVIEKPAEGKQPEPFGPVLPLGLAWPVIYTLIVLAALTLIVFIGLWILKTKLHYKKLMELLKDYESTVSPDLQFYKAIRNAEVIGHPLDQLLKSYRQYILRTYQIPAFNLSDAELLSFFKKKYPWLKKERLEIKKILSDFQVAEKKAQDPNLKDLNSTKKSLILKMYHFVDRSEVLRTRNLR